MVNYNMLMNEGNGIGSKGELKGKEECVGDGNGGGEHQRGGY